MKWLFGVASLALFTSGASWAWFHHLDEAGKASDAMLDWKTRLIAIHGFSAMIFVLILGILLATHVRRSWHARKNRNNGIFFLAFVVLLTLTGYSLYYLSDEQWRAHCSDLHLWVGLASPALLALHIYLGIKSVRQND